MVEGLLRHLVPAVDAVHDLQGAKTGSFDSALLQPAHEVLGLARHSQAQEGVQSKRRVADPGVAVVPVAHPADLFGKAARRCRDDRPGRREGQQLQHQGRAVDHLAPAAIVAALAQPAPPELEGLRQQLGADEPRLHQPGVAITLDLAQDERRWLTRVQQELGGDPRALARQRKAADQREAHAGGLKHRAAAFQSDLMRPPRVVESGLAFEPEAHGPAHGPHDANDLVRLLAAARVLDRHEVDHFADPLGAEEARHQHVAVGQVHLLVLGLVEAGDLEEASFVLVENRGEDAWRVEVRQAAPVDRTVHAHQRDRVQVADDTVGLDRLIGHLLTGLSNFRRYRRKKPPFCPSLSHWGSLLLRFHSLDGGQGFDVCRDGDPILGRELRSTANHLGHGRCLSFRPSKPGFARRARAGIQ